MSGWGGGRGRGGRESGVGMLFARVLTGPGPQVPTLPPCELFGLLHLNHMRILLAGWAITKSEFIFGLLVAEKTTLWSEHKQSTVSLPPYTNRIPGF